MIYCEGVDCPLSIKCERLELLERGWFGYDADIRLHLCETDQYEKYIEYSEE